ncbi:MAG: hypothetical protein COZ34_02020 [Candidatus Pacebacteria bacterium CG_4_10_14_3_um_filter_34_15]|nr:MAG: hypothetical protein AUJ41_00250 [Candidatus Pacebacteria bacterium CG1_02_43_31]PIQ80865.1 MAG: hypothetical protein COV78_03380 [Candidatus Pacebacteria bacterium CG11_big_fil_rev_8_21_14_0_20_34_55]PIX81698.1 MAG: hypothetical protein COZ34_02020 [Candidatus Pacebacteria bacterium CG_4_10_14_3_um_filter_34_15]PJC43447.1 MAG: hypothetical protein CO039_04100 [Candidatus Pacebacteria bacterium CG_4_9_14_0_2_um_filter_34_50]
MLINPGAYNHVPIWVGGFKNLSRKRAAKFGDGYMPLGDADFFADNLENLLQYLEMYGRDPNEFKTMGRVALGKTPTNQWVDNFLEWQRLGVSHIVLTTTVDEKNEAEKNPDPWHHRHLIFEFMSATNWLRKPNDTFSSIFSKWSRVEAPEEITKKITGKEKDQINYLYSLELKPNIKPKHVIMYLESKGFTKFHIEGTANFPQHSEKPYHFIEGMKNKKDQKVAILQENSDEQKFILVYSSEIEMGLGKL